MHPNAPSGGYDLHAGTHGYDNAPLMSHGNQDFSSQGAYATAPPSTTLKTMQTNTYMNLVFFGAACAIIAGGLISSIFLFWSAQFADAVLAMYMLSFGAVLAVLDNPFYKQMKIMVDAKMYIGKYVNILTRMTGKGLCFVFLGCSLFAAMWDNLSSAFLLFLAVILCMFPVFVGMAAIFIGITKSQKLAKARHALAAGSPEQWYDQMAQTFRGPHGGLTPTEFNELTTRNGGFKWELAELKFIFNALVSNPAWRMNAVTQSQSSSSRPGNIDETKMPKEDLMAWIKHGWVFV